MDTEQSADDRFKDIAINVIQKTKARKKSMKKPINLNNRSILITGAAGFIGAALTQRILKECTGTKVVGLDNLND